MSLSFRQSDILEIIRTDGRVTVDALAEQFDVAAQTIRRDLGDMADAGLVDRVHGGAVQRSGVSNIGYEDRRILNEPAKQAIARRCAAEIPNGASVFLNIGTTTESVAKELLNKNNLLIVTNNINVAMTLTQNPHAEVVLTGGALRRSDGGLIGALAVQTIRQFKFDIAVIGCSALDRDGDLLDFDISEVAVSQTILAQARRSILVADRSKFQRSAPARIAPLSRIDMLITDHALPPALAARCAEWETQVLISPPQTRGS